MQHAVYIFFFAVASPMTYMPKFINAPNAVQLTLFWKTKFKMCLNIPYFYRNLPTLLSVSSQTKKEEDSSSET